MDITQLITARVFAYNELSGKGSASFYSEVDGEHTLSVIEINIDDYCVLEIEDGSVQWQPHSTHVTPDLHFTEIVCRQVASGRASLSSSVGHSGLHQRASNPGDQQQVLERLVRICACCP